MNAIEKKRSLPKRTPFDAQDFTRIRKGIHLGRHLVKGKARRTKWITCYVNIMLPGKHRPEQQQQESRALLQVCFTLQSIWTGNLREKHWVLISTKIIQYAFFSFLHSVTNRCYTRWRKKCVGMCLISLKGTYPFWEMNYILGAFFKFGMDHQNSHSSVLHLVVKCPNQDKRSIKNNNARFK